MFVLVKKHRIHESGAESAASENFADNEYDTALKKFYQYLSNLVADTTVEQADLVILNGSLIPCKTEHYVRRYELPEAEE